MLGKLLRAVSLRIRVKYIFVEAVLSEVDVLLLDEYFEGQYVQKLNEVLSEKIPLISVHSDDLFIIYFRLLLIVFLLEFIVRQLKGGTEFLSLPEDSQA